MEQEKTLTVDAFLIDELDKDKKVVKSLLTIPYKADKTPKALRVYSENGVIILYASTRLELLLKIEEGYQVDVTVKENLTGKKYELHEQGTGKLLQSGKITAKSAASNVYEMPKTGSE